MAKTWTVNVDGVEHHISFKPGAFSPRLTVNGTEKKLKNKNWFIQMLDEPIQLGSKTANLTVIGRKVDLAVDGTYLGSGEAYVPLSDVPKWANILTIALIVSGWFFAGIIGIAIGVLGAMNIISTSISTKKKNPMLRIIITAVVCLILQLLIMFMLI